MNQSLNKKIAVIVPAYNVQKYIGQCLESLVNQTYENIEILVINDGSTDDTLKIINEFAAKDKRITIISQENKGVSAARNLAIQQVEADYIMFLDSDDWLELETCEETLKEAGENDADIVMFGYIREYEKNSLKKATFEEEKILFKDEEVQKKLHRRIFGPLEKELESPEKLNVLTPVCMKLYKAEVIKGLNFVDIKDIGICEDGYFNISAFENSKRVVFLKKHFYHYRKIIANGSLTQKKDSKIFDKTKMFYNILSEKIKEKHFPEEYNKALDNRLVLSLIENSITLINSRNEVYKNLKNILNDVDYKKAISNLELKYFPIHWKAFFFFAKIRFVFGVYFLANLMVKLIDKK